METIIKINPSELNVELLEKIKSIIGNKHNINVTISLNEFNPDYVNDLNASIYQAENSNDVITFTMEEFMEYSPMKHD